MATKAKEEIITISHKIKAKDENGKALMKDGKYVWEEVIKKYHVEPSFVPKKIDEICEEFIQNYCEAKGEEDWLIDQYNQKETVYVKDKNDKKKIVEVKEQDKSFVSIRSAFTNKFFPDIIVGAPAKKETKREKWLAKRKKEE